MNIVLIYRCADTVRVLKVWTNLANTLSLCSPAKQTGLRIGTLFRYKHTLCSLWYIALQNKPTNSIKNLQIFSSVVSVNQVRAKTMRMINYDHSLVGYQTLRVRENC